MNVLDKSAIREYTSCQMCGAVCPKDAISIELNKDGFYRPVVNAEKCIDCGICTKVCYKFDKEIRITSDEGLQYMPLYAAAAKSDELVAQVTSGGIADLLAKELIKEGYTCIGVGYDDTKARAYHYAANTAEETDGFRGSKYIQSYSLQAFQELVKNCRQKRYAVFGTPCQVYAIHRILEQRKIRNQFILIDLYCHGCPSIHIWTKYQSEVKAKIQKSYFDKVEFRSKIKGWGGFYVVAIVGGVKAFISSPKCDEFYEMFFSDHVLNKACSDCKLRSTMEYTDIRLGDFWGRKYALNKRGVSAVSLITNRGDELFQKIAPQIENELCKYDEFLPFQSYGKEYHLNLDLRKRLLDILSDVNRPLMDAVKLYHNNQSIIQILKRYIKHMLYYMPIAVTKYIKRYIL